MASFAYKAMSADGRLVRGRLAAANVADLEQRLRRLGLDFITGQPTSPRRWRLKSPVSRRELIHFCFQLEQLLQAGVPILEALVDLRDTTANPHFREIVAALMESIDGGQTLSQALEAHPKVFSRPFSSLVRAGENAGRMPAVLASLAQSLKWEDELASYSRRLLIYPAMVALVILAALSVSLVQVVPELARLFKTSGQALPLNTRLLIGLSDFVVQYGWALLATLLAGAIGLRLALAMSRPLRYRLDQLRLALPIIGPIQRKILISRFANLFALMYGAGITILDAVHSCEQAAGNAVLRRGLRQAGQSMAEGQSLTQAFHHTGLFPPLVIRMLKLGESTGALDKALANLGYFYTRDVKESVERAQALMEPLLTMVLGSLLAWVMLSVLGPIYDVMTRIQF